MRMAWAVMFSIVVAMAGYVSVSGQTSLAAQIAKEHAELKASVDAFAKAYPDSELSERFFKKFEAHDRRLRIMPCEMR